MVLEIHKSGSGGRLVGQVAVVTGGTSGIGHKVCLALAREGARVVVVGRNRLRLEAVRTEVDAINDVYGYTAAALGLELDVSREQDMADMARLTLEHFGGLDILIAAAGILRGPNSRPTILAELNAAEWHLVVNTNLTGVFLSNRAALGIMREQRSGQIINISSLSGRRAVPFDAAYCASKFGVIGLTESLADEMRPYGVRVQVVLPGNTDTPIWSQNDPLPRAVQLVPANQVADLIIFLLTQPPEAFLGELALAPRRAWAPPPGRQRGRLGGVGFGGLE